MPGLGGSSHRSQNVDTPKSGIFSIHSRNQRRHDRDILSTMNDLKLINEGLKALR